MNEKDCLSEASQIITQTANLIKEMQKPENPRENLIDFVWSMQFILDNVNNSGD